MTPVEMLEIITKQNPIHGGCGTAASQNKFCAAIHAVINTSQFATDSKPALMEHFNIDSYTPKQIAERIEKASISKSTQDPSRIFILALLAGAFIAFGAAFFTFVIHDSALGQGLTKLLGGLVFCLGLILVVVAGAELFTGNNLLVMACVDQKITFKQLMNNWTIVFVGNFIGCLAIAVLIYLSGHWAGESARVGAKALMIANAKVNLPFVQALTRGILCNALVCMAVWLCFAGRSSTDKLLSILFPITAFVTLGFEHSVANMYFIPAGLLIKSDPQLMTSIQPLLPASADLSQLTLSGFLLNNLLPVTIGNIFGGSFFVGIIYWYIYLRR